MAVTVTRLRLTETGQKDRYNKPIMSRIETTHTAHGFAPLVASDVSGVEQIVSRDGGTLYFRAPNLTFAEPDDQFVVRGVVYDVDGRDAYWQHVNGVDKGTVIILTRAEYTDA